MSNSIRNAHRALIPLAAAVSLGLAGCSETASNLLSTGSLTAAKPVAEKAPTPTDRMLQVAALSARAQKCGYTFDPVALRSAYLANEAGRGLTPESVANLGQQYDFTHRTVARRIQAEDKYCTQDRLTIVRADLQRHLRGDYSLRVKKRGIEKGFFETDQETKTELNPNFGIEPDAQPQRTVKVE
ncbi:MAG: hypothetical protein AAFY64_09655 [Pseudomonadota bacterium]